MEALWRPRAGRSLEAGPGSAASGLMVPAVYDGDAAALTLYQESVISRK
jgi:hypothetical protein